MREGPSQASDRLFLVDGFHRREKALNAAAQLRVHVQMDAVGGERDAELLPECKSFGRRVRSLVQERVVQWEVKSFAIASEIDPVIALERLYLAHPADEVLHVCCGDRLLVV